MVSGRNGFNSTADQTGTDMVTFWNVAEALLHVVVALTDTLAWVIAPARVQLFASVTA